MTDTPSPSAAGPLPLPSVETITSLRLPPFWASDPHLWFAQVEAQFSARHITSQATKYGHVLAALPPEIAVEIRDLILTPPSERPYDTIKDELIKRIATSEQRRLQQLLTSEELGDRRPSQLLRRMRQLLGNSTTETSLLKQLFLQRLPSQVQIVLAAAGDVSLDDQANLADRIMDLTDTTRCPLPQVAALNSARADTIAQTSPTLAAPSPDPLSTSVAALSTDVHELRATVSSLTQLVATLMTTHHPGHRARSPRERSPRSQGYQRRRSPFRSPARSPPPGIGICWYHYNFGSAARNCSQPCSWAGNPNPGN